MESGLSDADVERALETCAEEPVHIPGTIQSFGCLLACSRETGIVTHVSQNIGTLLTGGAEAFLGKHLRDVLSSEIWHGLNNVASMANHSTQRGLVGMHPTANGMIEIWAFGSGDFHVLELEVASDHDMPSTEMMRTLSTLLGRIQPCTDLQMLLGLTTRMLRHLTGYDRVMVYQFDRDWNGEVVAEDCQVSIEPFVGLRFPHWDIPAQAREIMLRLPLRLIENVAAEVSPIRAAASNGPPLDMSVGQLRGVSPVHLQYLRNMGSSGTMTLSICVGGKLWGMISFHHRRPKLPSLRMREVLTSFASVFSDKVTLIEQREQLALAQQVDLLKDSILAGEANLWDEETPIAAVAPTILSALDAQGIVLASANSTHVGTTPDQGIVDALTAMREASLDNVLVIENLKAKFPDQYDQLNRCAGVLVVPARSERAILVFREEVSLAVSWAGNPDKTISRSDGQLRLEPRGSFSTYLQKTKDSCRPWSGHDLQLASQIWTILDAAERQLLAERLMRQQGLMIDELNHRVRNILALVRSVSQQSKRGNGSLDSYAKALEARVLALAAAHNIGAEAPMASASIREIIETEIRPYIPKSDPSLKLDGDDRLIAAGVAPLFALVIHELSTNAAKYGALSNSSGWVSVSLRRAEGGHEVEWIESGGPLVKDPIEVGFGTALIRQSVPHELKGRTDFEFRPEGVRAKIFLPDEILEPAGVFSPRRVKPDDEVTVDHFGDTSKNRPRGTALLVEDNFIIATEMSDQLRDFGFDDVAVFSNSEDAKAFLATERPVAAVLDINLGRSGDSQPVARHLKDLGVPFLFATGYGDSRTLAPEFGEVLRLTKPVTVRDLKDAIARLLASH